MAAEFNATFKVTGLTITAEMEGGPVLQTKTVEPTLEGVTVTPDKGYTGLSSVEVEPVAVQEKTVDPSTVAQTITPDSGYLGLSSVEVEAVALQEKNVAPSTVSQTVTPDAGYDGLSAVEVGAIRLQSKAVAPSTNAQTVTPETGYNGLSAVEVGAVALQSKAVAPSTQTQTVEPDSNYMGLSAVEVAAMELQSKSVTPTEQTQTVTPDSGKDGLSSVEVGAIPSEYVVPSGTVAITQNGTANVAGYASAEVDVQPTLQSKSVTPTEQTQNVTPDTGYDGLSGVSVGAIPAEYIIPEGQIEITENGEVDVSAFASALVNVAGGVASNVVTGSFTLEDTGATHEVEIEIPYNGTGYPLSVCIVPDMIADGISIVRRNGIYQYALIKEIKEDAPNYAVGSSDTDNRAWSLAAYKFGTSVNTAVSGSASSANYVYGTTPFSDTASGVLRIRRSNALNLMVASLNDTAFGFLPTTYNYFILYSE